jgi:hypothetical protein
VGDTARATRTARNSAPKNSAGRARSCQPGAWRIRAARKNGAAIVAMALTRPAARWTLPCQELAAAAAVQVGSAAWQSRREEGVGEVVEAVDPSGPGREVGDGLSANGARERHRGTRPLQRRLPGSDAAQHPRRSRVGDEEPAGLDDSRATGGRQPPGAGTGQTVMETRATPRPMAAELVAIWMERRRSCAWASARGTGCSWPRVSKL